jgi:hypothetical protein
MDDPGRMNAERDASVRTDGLARVACVPCTNL